MFLIISTRERQPPIVVDVPKFASKLGEVFHTLVIQRKYVTYVRNSLITHIEINEYDSFENSHATLM